MAAKKKDEAGDMAVLELVTGEMEFAVLGTTPLICNRMSQKVIRQLLLPPQKKNAAERASSLKHEPLEEYRESPYKLREPDAPTLIALPATTFKGALRNAALDIPGAKKTEIGRLTYVQGEYIPIFGVPQIFCSVTRSADINKTPDVRTRAIIPQWACRIVVSFTKPIMKEQAIANLLAAAGITNGVGDWRPQKGSGTFGQFKLVSPSDPKFKAVVESGGRAAQAAALESPEAYDAETEELLAWFDVETKRRGFKVAA